MDAWTWTCQYLQIATTKGATYLVAPCPELQRTVHKAPAPNNGAWSPEAKSRLATRLREIRDEGGTTRPPGRTVKNQASIRYTEQLVDLMALHPTWTQKQLGDAVGISQPAVSILLKAIRAA